MYRTITFVAALLTASAGLAQTPIAYVKGSTKGDAIYLIGSDGTGETKIYQAPRTGRFGGQIDRLSISPDGTEVAFVLNDTQLMVKRIGSGTVNDADQINVGAGCAFFDPDYRADGDLYVGASCSGPGQIWLVDTVAETATPVVENVNYSGLAARGNDLLYVADSGSIDTSGGLSGTLYLRSSAGGAPTAVGTIDYSLPLYIDAVEDTGVLSGRSSYRTVDLTNGAEAVGCWTGGMVEYSPDGTEMVYEFRNTLFVLNSDCSGAPFRLARGADAVDW
jgi:hypothetical protein